MKEAEIRDLVRRMFIEVLGVKEEDFSFEKVGEDIDEWDSLSHMTLVSELENDLGISMEIEEISEMDSVENVVKVLKRKVGS